MESVQDSAGNQASAVSLVRKLDLLDSMALVIGVIIGSGIFLVPGSVAGQLGSLLSVIGVWIVGGVLSIFGGLALAELGASLPTAGGLYVYIERAYGRLVGFIYGWMGLAIINTGSGATMADCPHRFRSSSACSSFSEIASHHSGVIWAVTPADSTMALARNREYFRRRRASSLSHAWATSS